MRRRFDIGDGGSNPSLALFFLNFFFISFFFFFFFCHLIFSSFCINFFIRKFSQMLLNQTDVTVDEELGKVIMAIVSSTERRR